MASFRKGNAQYRSTFYSISFLFDPVTCGKRKMKNRKFSKQKIMHVLKMSKKKPFLSEYSSTC
jgi:hypothetical protein